MEKYQNEDELGLVNDNENEINEKILLYGENNTCNYQKYYILDKTWFDKYKIFLKTQFNDNLFINIQDIYPVKKVKTIRIKNKKNNYLIPANFVLVNPKVFNYIINYFTKQKDLDIKNLCYETLIFGSCIIIKSNSEPNILNVAILKKEKINDNDTTYENYIKYIFDFNDNDSMETELKIMYSNGFNKYMKFTNFDDNKNYVEFREIQKKDNKCIGYLIYNRQGNNLDNIKLDKNNIGNTEKSITECIPYFISILFCLNQFENFKKSIKDFLSSNTNFELIMKFSNILDNISNNKNIDNKFISQFIPSSNLLCYENIINEIFIKLNKELNKTKNKGYKDNNIQNEEMKARQLFKMQNNNLSIVENLFYLIVQQKISCEKCNLTLFEYKFSKFLMIELEKNENNILIKDKLFEIKKKYEKCKRCDNNKCNEIKIEEVPQILIVVIKSKDNKKISLQNQFKIIENKLLYSLNCFIEKNTHNCYFKKGSSWYKFDIKSNEEIEYNNIYEIDTSVLFYKAMFKEQKFQINNKNNQMINNINCNINNNFQNNIKSNTSNINRNNIMINNNLNMRNINQQVNNYNNINNYQTSNMNQQVNNNMQMNFINQQVNNYNNINKFQTNKMNQLMNNNMQMNFINQQVNNYNNINNFQINNMNKQINNNKNMNNMNNINNQNNFNQMNNINIQNNMNNQNNVNSMNNQVFLNNQNNMINQNSFNNMNVINNPMLLNKQLNINNHINLNNQNNFNNMNNQMKMNNPQLNNNIQNINTEIVLNNLQNNNNMNNTKIIENNIAHNQEKFIFITFTFAKNKKQIYIDVNENDSFENTINLIEEKYNWLRNIKERTYFLKDNKISDYKLSLKQLGIFDNSDIIIKTD